MSRHLRYVITGAPCTGKSTLIAHIKTYNYNVFPEVAREIIKQELASNNDNVPWINNQGFSELVIKQQLSDYKNASIGINFYDRAIPDVIAYFNYYKQNNLKEQFYPLAKKHLYQKDVFILPPWKKIYEEDSERKESFEEAIIIHEKLFETYRSLGYKIILVPFASTEERVKFILSHLKE